MTRAEQVAFKRLDKRRNELFSALCIIYTWIKSPWCAQSAEELVAMVAELVSRKIEEERAAQRREEARCQPTAN